jgi:hypothetical protein
LEGKYLEAESVKNRVNELKQNMSGQKKRDLTSQHNSEMQNLEENYNKDIEEMNQKWEVLFLEFNEKAKKLDEEMNARQKGEMEELMALLDMKLPKLVKFSREYLDLKQSELNLVKQER